VADNFQIDLDPNAFIVPTSNGPLRKVVQDRAYLGFDASTEWSAASVTLQMPAAYTGSGTLKADMGYFMDSATSGNVVWGVQVEAITDGDSINLSTTSSFDTTNNGTSAVPGTAGYPKSLTISLTNKDSVAAGDWVRIKVARKAADGSDTATGNANLFSLRIREEA